MERNEFLLRRIQEKLCHATHVTQGDFRTAGFHSDQHKTVLDGWKGSLALQVLDTMS